LIAKTRVSVALCGFRTSTAVEARGEPQQPRKDQTCTAQQKAVSPDSADVEQSVCSVPKQYPLILPDDRLGRIEVAAPNSINRFSLHSKTY